MSDLYARIETLCDAKDVNVTGMCKASGVARSILSDYHTGRKKNISAPHLAKIADYFDVPLDFLLARPPFDCWNTLNADRRALVDAMQFPGAVYEQLIGPEGVGSWNAIEYIKFLAATVERVEVVEGGRIAEGIPTPYAYATGGETHAAEPSARELLRAAFVKAGILAADRPLTDEQYNFLIGAANGFLNPPTL